MPPKTVIPGDVLEDGGRATLNQVRLFGGGQVWRRSEKRGKLRNELYRWRKDSTGRVKRKETREGQMAWSRKNKGQSGL